MSDLNEPRCINPEQVEFDTQRAAEDTWEALLSAGVFIEGEFTFASGQQATLKADAEKLYTQPKQLAVVMGYFATYPCVQDADVLLYVPDGMRKFVTMLGSELDKPVVGTSRKPGASKYDFVFASEADQELAQGAKAPVIGEDIVTTLGSVAGMRKLLKPDQPVHSLAILLRDTVNPVYQKGLVDHYLLTKEIPTSKDEFRRMLAEDNF
jgi:orotate phosphoribosyltransferase